MLLAVQTPAESDRGPKYCEQLLAAVHQANTRRAPVTFAFDRLGNAVGLYCECDPALQAVLQGQLLARYPDAHVARLPDDVFSVPDSSVQYVAELHLKPDIFPFRRHPEFIDESSRETADPITGILEAVASAPYQARVEIVTTPALTSRTRHARNAIERLAQPFFRAHRRLARLYTSGVCNRFLAIRSFTRLFGTVAATSDRFMHADPLSLSATRGHDREDDLQAAATKLKGHLFESRVRLIVHVPRNDVERAEQTLRHLASAFGQFQGLASFHLTRKPLRRPFLLSCEELATLWHPPLGTVKASKMETTLSRSLEAPATVPLTKREAELAVLGRLQFRDDRDVFGIRFEDRFRHMAVIGKTGMGKSTLLQDLIVSDMQQGRGVALIDPHGDLADTVTALVPRRRTNDVVLFDAGDRAYPLAFNPLSASTPEQRPGIASGVLSAFKKLYGDSWGPRTEHILRNCLLALLEVPGTSLVSLMQLLSDAQYRQGIIGRVCDPAVRLFWLQEFGGWNERYRTEAIAPIQNKIGQFVTHPILRGLIGQPRSTLHLRTIMDEQRILVVNLSKGRVGEDVSTLLGSLLVTSLQMAAMSRADQPEQNRVPFFAYVDEFQNFATDSFATILSEARKYRLALTVANQYLDQMEQGTREAVFGNVGSLLSFQVGPRDAAVLSEQLAGDVRPEDLVRLPKYAAYVRLLIDGMPSRPFSMRTLPPPAIDSNTKRPDRVRAVSRRRYARSIAEVEQLIGNAFVATG